MYGREVRREEGGGGDYQTMRGSSPRQPRLAQPAGTGKVSLVEGLSSPPSRGSPPMHTPFSAI
jgi:hypothetical protein